MVNYRSGMLRPIRPRPKRRLPFTIGPFVGLRDSRDPASAEQVLARELRNLYPLQAGNASSVVGRPGIEVVGAQLGAGGARTGQLVHQFTKINGTQHTVAIVGGKFYTLDWSSKTWTEVLTAAHLSGQSITLAADRRCYAVTFNDKLIVSDGLNRPWAWDGTAGAGLTKLTNCPVLFGAPTVRSAKLVGIESGQRSSIVWSEENQPNVGYKATIDMKVYNNAWDLIQTDEDFLVAVVGTNDALYVFRTRSSTAILGDIDAEFRTTSTDEAISESVGTASPGSVLKHKRNIYFTDADGRPHVIIPSVGLAEIFQNIAESVGGLHGFDEVEGYYHPGIDVIGMAYSETTATEKRGNHLMFESRDGGGQVPLSIFDGFEHNRIGTVVDGDGKPAVMHLSPDGYAYVHGRVGGNIWDDKFVAGDVPITHIVETPELGIIHPFTGEPDFYDKDWDRIDIAVRSLTDITATCHYRTERQGLSDGQEFTISGAGGARFGSAVYGTSVYADDSAREKHVGLGIDGLGRWIQIRIEHAQLGEQFGFNFGRVEGVRAGLPST